MIIEKVLPRAVDGIAILRDRLVNEGIARGIGIDDIEKMISNVPALILNSGCFLDKLTGLWRYEYGMPWAIGLNRCLYGTWMWIPVKTLFSVVQGAIFRLSVGQMTKYLNRLADPEKHGDYLAEFLPVLRLSSDITAEFEVSTGEGNHNVDWRICCPLGRSIFVDVKRRMRDLLEAMKQVDTGEKGQSGLGPEPAHDVSVLFRSIENKYSQQKPGQQLQGIWVATEVQQENSELYLAFDHVDHMKVHFAVLGDWDPGIKLLVRREEDRQYLLDIFHEVASDRFSFTRAAKSKAG